VPSASASFEPEPASVGAARRYAVGQLTEPTLAHLHDDIRTIVSELATNAVLHARTPFTISVQVDYAHVLVAVADASPARPRLPRRGDGAGMTGRGLRIVAQLSVEWGVDVRADGKTTWCKLAATRPGRLTGRSEVSDEPAPPVVPAAATDGLKAKGRPDTATAEGPSRRPLDHLPVVAA
jgi:anti-sigma regulatory factor (Ser/Thr protein kinase)